MIVTPFTLAGAMAPVTMAGAVTQSIAEGLAAIALFQFINPGAPCVLGTFTSNVDMKSGAPAFGTPEYVRAHSNGPARWRGSTVYPYEPRTPAPANAPDGQAVWESMNSLWAAGAVPGQCRLPLRWMARRWSDRVLQRSFVMDCEVLQQFQRYFDPILTDTGPGGIALDAIEEVGPNGHFFGTQHTQDRYTTAFYSPFLSDWSNYEAWSEAGGIWTAERANRIWKKILAEFEPPPMEDGIREELRAFVDRRISEGGAPTDF